MTAIQTAPAPEASSARKQASPARLEATDRLEWLIDNADGFRAFVALVRGARRDLWISQLAFDADCVAYEVPDASGPGMSSTVTLADELRRAVGRGVRVRVLLNASLLLDTVAPLRRWLAAGDAASRFQVRGIHRFPQLLHAKMVIADEEDALLLGSPFANGYWDDSTHAPIEARRPDRELGGRPIHDVSVRLGGPAVRELSRTFAELWNHAGDIAPGEEEPLRPASPPPTGVAPRDDAMRVVRTAPRRSTPHHPDGRMEILPALLDGIARARSVIYIEHQYLSSRRVIDALVAALARVPTLELIVVLNQNPDVTAYRVWQNTRLRDAGLSDHPRVGLFALWSVAPTSSGSTLLTQLFVHSKVVVIDDRWAMTGSANLDGVSLHSYGADFASALGQRVFRDVRNFDVNLVVDADASDDGANAAGDAVRSLRRALWHEHLGASASSLDGEAGALEAWRAAARANIGALCTRRAGPTARTLVLPYVTPSTPRAQLAALGIVPDAGSLALCFRPSWLEVHASPNWIRNMLA
ncbi:MAG: phosphatidylserine/phosphatidylglycerophosphate/cardiolipin synthase family protein [bacterium]